MANHAEAFRLMTYQCKRCGHRERIWNSRDGVTPFGIGPCQRCGGNDVLHVEWNADIYAPHHQLKPGERFFRDGTPAEARAIFRRRIEQCPDYAPPEGPERDAYIEQALSDEYSEFRPGWPMLDTYEPADASPAPECEWREDGSEFSVLAWRACGGRRWTSPAGFIYCPFCAKPLRAVPYQPAQPDAEGGGDRG